MVSSLSSPLPKFCNLGFQDQNEILFEKELKTTRNQRCDFVSQGPKNHGRKTEIQKAYEYRHVLRITWKSGHVDRMHPKSGQIPCQDLFLK